MEAYFKKIGGKGKCSYGFSFGVDNGEQNGRFIILHYNYCLQGKKENGEWETEVNWHQSTHINENPEYNKLTLKKQGSQLFIFVNEKYIFQTKALPLFGKNFGFILFGDIMVKID